MIKDLKIKWTGEKPNNELKISGLR